MIHPTAIIDDSAILGDGVSVGPWSLIGPGVRIGANCRIGAHVVLEGPTILGERNEIHPFAAVGVAPQDKKYRGEASELVIGDDNVIREGCTINRGTELGGNLTRIGNGNLLMAYVHIAHDCLIGNENIFANYSALAGHVVIDDYVGLGGYAAIHQFCHVGSYSFIGKACIVTQDVMPYGLVSGEGGKARVYGLNKVGLTRRGFSAERVQQLKQAYGVIFQEGHSREESMALLDSMSVENTDLVPLYEALLRATRGITR